MFKKATTFLLAITLVVLTTACEKQDSSDLQKSTNGAGNITTSENSNNITAASREKTALVTFPKSATGTRKSLTTRKISKLTRRPELKIVQTVLPKSTISTEFDKKLEELCKKHGASFSTDENYLYVKAMRKTARTIADEYCDFFLEEANTDTSSTVVKTKFRVKYSSLQLTVTDDFENSPEAQSVYFLVNPIIQMQLLNGLHGDRISCSIIIIGESPEHRQVKTISYPQDFEGADAVNDVLVQLNIE